MEGSLENWTSFCEDLYSGHNIPKFSSTYCDDGELDQQITANEFENAEDQELLPGCKTSLKIFFSMINTFWKKEKVQQDLKTFVLRPFLKDKNESEHDPSNYSPISLLNTFFKLYETLIYSRLVEKLDKL